MPVATTRMNAAYVVRHSGMSSCSCGGDGGGGSEACKGRAVDRAVNVSVEIRHVARVDEDNDSTVSGGEDARADDVFPDDGRSSYTSVTTGRPKGVARTDLCTRSALVD